MNLYSKLSALGAVLVLTTAFVSADTVNINSSANSGSGGTVYLGQVLGGTPVNTTPVTPGGSPSITQGSNNTPVGNPGFTFVVDPDTVWSSAIGTSKWVSYDPHSGPTGGENGGSVPFDANGFYYYEQAVTTNGGTWSGSVTVQADDTVAVYLNSVSAGNLLLNYGNIGGDSHCADNPPACVMAPATFNLGSFDSGFNNDGTNELIFVVAQTGSIYQGVDFSGSISNPVPTPEPNTLFLLGTGLLGSAGTLLRKMRAKA
jgi:hypothetical protein